MAPQRLSRPARRLEALPHLTRKTKFPQTLTDEEPIVSHELSFIRPFPRVYRCGTRSSLLAIAVVPWCFSSFHLDCTGRWHQDELS
jgi:hypothetical protein